jgi:hypothetical protein
MSDGTGEAPKKETVFGGPNPAMDNQAFANPGTTGTVYGGSSPTQGTVYGGPTPGGTVYGGAGTPTAQRMPVAGGVSPQVLNSANWFFWIAALSLINSFITMSGSHWQFFLGLGITQAVDGIGSVAGSPAVAFVINLFITGFVAMFGIFARKGQKWAFLVGMILYALDGVLVLIATDFIAAAFHAFVLFAIFRGFRQLD